MRLFFWLVIGLAMLLLTAGVTLKILRARDQDRIDSLFVTLRSETVGARIDPAELSDLPEPARRFLLWAIPEGTPRYGSVELDWVGTFRLGPGSEWLRFDAREILNPSRGTLLSMSIGDHLSGAESFVDGVAEARFWSRDFVPSNASGTDLDRGARSRMALLRLLLPTSLLPGAGVRWTTPGPDRLVADVPVTGRPERVELTIGADGALKSARVMRWGPRAEDGVFQEIPFGFTVEEVGEMAGITLPARIRWSWWIGTDREEMFQRVQLQTAQFR